MAASRSSWSLGSTTELRQIETQSASDCQKSGDDDHGDGDDGPEIYGFVVATPTTGLTGTWTISNTNDITGTDYTTTDTTKFEMEYGPLEVGACVEAYLLPDGSNTVTKLESKPAYKCDRSDDDERRRWA